MGQKHFRRIAVQFTIYQVSSRLSACELIYWERRESAIFTLQSLDIY